MHPHHPVLSRFGRPLSGLAWRRVAGGFSGAEVWRGDDNDGRPQVALKCWPAGYSPQRLLQIHKWIGRAAQHLSYIPSIVMALDGNSVVAEGGRIWDASCWIPGEPQLTATVPEVEAACAAVAKLHVIWRGSDRAPCPGVHNRLRILRDWLASPPTFGTNKTFAPNLNRLLRCASRLLAELAPRTVTQLEVWECNALFLQPCVRDLRGEHVLFTGPSVSGIIDFGAMAIDSPAVDLARLLGELGAGNTEVIAAGLRSYHQAGGILDAPDEFVRLLAFSGTLGSMTTWIERLRCGDLGNTSIATAEARLQLLVDRIEECKPL